MTRLYLIRHATHDRVGKRLSGRMPGIGLSAEGEAQAEHLRRHFAAQPVGAVVSSPLQRCRETAARIAGPLGLPVEIHPALDEIDCGAWTGMSFDALDRDARWHAWNADRGRAGIPGGETIEAVETRIMALVAELGATSRAPVALITHADVIKAALLALLGASPDRHARLGIDPASVTTLDLWPGGGTLVRMNERVAP